MNRLRPAIMYCKAFLALLALAATALASIATSSAAQGPELTAAAASAPDERLQAARELAWGGHLPEAIAAVRKILDAAPERVDARFELARYLSWSGAHREAIEHADQILTLRPDDTGALRVKADASSWRGDFATALTHYRRALDLGDDAELRLAYAHALLGAGHLSEARRQHSRLRALPEASQPDGIAALERRIDRLGSPAIRAGIRRYRDTDASTRSEYRLRIERGVGDARLRLLAETIDARDRVRTVDARRIGVGVGLPIAAGITLEASGGLVRVEDSRRDTYAEGMLQARGRSGPTAYQGRLERNVFTETAAILGNRIRRTELEARVEHAPTDRLRLAGRYEFTDFSDDNASHEVEITPQVVLWQGDPGLRLGYRHTLLTFDRQSGSGYFDPDRLAADRLMLFATRFGDRARWDFELFAGRQEFRRSGLRQKDNIVGGSGRLSLDLGRRWTLEAELEGGNFALQTAGGFRYWLLALDLVGRF